MKKKLLLLALAPVLALAFTVCAPVPFDRYGQTLLDVPYCTMDGEPQRMDVYFPASGGPWPALVYIHGGGWTEGDKSEATDLGAEMSARGYVVFSLNYRLYPAARFPAMIEDVKCAIRSMRAHASAYNLDPQRIGAMGASAGGHLAALLGTTDANAGFEAGEYLRQSSRVQAVVAMSGLTDLGRDFPNRGIETLILVNFGRDQMVSGSPVTYATPDDPPFLILHGDNDGVVPVEQGALMQEALTTAGAPSQLVIVTNGDHGLSSFDGTSRPTPDEIWALIVEFLDANLMAVRP
ncbi:MAG: alpha/beta hydrolase [Anaerolineales bacterium]|nr:alpha/beta hydrolase [Anaerolineales bacterium]